MIIPFRSTAVGVGIGIGSPVATPTSHPSTRAGDFLVLAIHGFWATSLGAGVITAPAGYTLIKRSDITLSGVNLAVVAHYYKTAGVSGAVTDTVAFDAAFTGSTTQATITTYAGCSGLTGTAQDIAGTTSPYTPTLAGASVYARNVIGQIFQGSTTNPLVTANGWTTVQILAGSTGQSGHICELTDRAPSMTAPSLGGGSRHAGVSYALASGISWGFNLPFGQRSGL